MNRWDAACPWAGFLELRGHGKQQIVTAGSCGGCTPIGSPSHIPVGTR